MMKRYMALAPLAAALALVACGTEDEATYETDAIDQSGGELQVSDPDAPGVDVNLPETPMTNAPPVIEGEDAATDEAAPPPG